MQIGDLDRRITLQVATTASDVFGEEIETWSTYREVWAKLAYVRGDEQFEAMEKTAVRVEKFFVRYDSGITEKMRVYWDSVYYDIRAIEQLGRKEYLVLKCERRD